MLVGRLFERIIGAGRLTVVDAHGKSHTFGGALPGPDVTIRLKDPNLHTTLALNPALKLGESYTDGTMTVDDGKLIDLLDLLGINLSRFESTPIAQFTQRLSMYLRPLQQFNERHRSRRNVAHHYDLSDDLYKLFLDPDRQYSCAYFRNETDTLEQAQLAKKQHIAAKLLLKPGQRVLDIGCGWGGLALFLAQQADVEVLGITLSQEQLGVARQRAQDAGLAGRVKFELIDYRDVAGPFDRIVSVGMFEHVGTRYYGDYFKAIDNLLTVDGVALLHSIGRMEPPGATNAWIRKYIFPGGYTPALSETTAAVEQTGLWVTDIEILRTHYALTLREWRKRFMAERETVKRLYDERFCRMWEFYLCACEASFRHWRQMVFQMQLARQLESVPIVRDYMVDWERGAAWQPSSATAAE